LIGGEYMMQRCPLCGNPGQKVPKQTVASMLAKSPSGKEFWICLTPTCKAAYYGKDDSLWMQDEVKVAIGFKDGAKPKYVCYCSGVTEQDIINAVLSKKAVTLSDAIQVTGAMKNGNCRTSNPTGMCCNRVFKEVFIRAQKMLEQNKW